MKVIQNERWLNKGTGKAIPPHYGPHSDLHIKKRVESRKGYSHSIETRKKIGEKSKGRRPNLGRVFSEEFRIKIGNSKRGTKATEEQKMRRSEFSKGSKNPMYGKKQPTLTCEHCGITLSKTNYKRFHGEKCKSIRGEK